MMPENLATLVSTGEAGTLELKDTIGTLREAGRC
jgi:hypothetical protein